jgi:pyruvate dehydrogenase E2 component (dihydrolipoamide acetyltransferase)
MTTGTISAWNKKVGDSVTAGDAIAEVQTDKATMAFESQDDFIIAKLLVEAGAEVSVGAPIMVTVEDAKDVAAFANFTVSAAGPAPSSAAAPNQAVSMPSSAPVAAAVSAGPQLFMPSARHLVESKNLNTDKIKGTAKGGRISKGDVIAAMKAGIAVPGAGAHAHTAAPVAAAASAKVAAPVTAAAPAVPVSAGPVVLVDPTGGQPINDKFKDIPNNNMRKIIAKRLTESKATVPHFYVSIECEVDELMALRKQFKKDFEVNVSVNDFVIRASSLALRDVPEVNAKWDVKSQSRVPPGPVDVSVAVATPSGLITPIIPATDKRGLDNISQKVKDLAKRAKDNKLKPEEFQGGSFTISNLGECKNVSDCQPPQLILTAY